MKAHIEEASGGGNRLSHGSAELTTRNLSGKLKLKTVLVPIDFSSLSLRAIPWAQAIAHLSGATVHFVHVHAFEYPVPAGVVPPTMLSARKVENRLLRGLRDVATEHHLRESVNRCHIRTGIAFDEICKVAREIDADLIVTSTHGRTGWKRLFLGSTAERVVRHTPCPVLIAREPRRAGPVMISKILAPIDFSPQSIRGLGFALGIARTFGASVTALHVLNRAQCLTPEGVVLYPEAELTQRDRLAAKEKMRQLVRNTDVSGLDFRTSIRLGYPEEEICNYAAYYGLDLIVAATHGRTGMRHVLLGSVAEHIVRYAKGPVLVIPTRRGAKGWR